VKSLYKYLVAFLFSIFCIIIFILPREIIFEINAKIPIDFQMTIYNINSYLFYFLTPYWLLFILTSKLCTLNKKICLFFTSQTVLNIFMSLYSLSLLLAFKYGNSQDLVEYYYGFVVQIPIFYVFFHFFLRILK
jgi:hypothetical protein